MNILIVDDNASNRKLVASLLGYEGHCVVEAADGADGLAAVQSTRPDLIISDILMPSMDGYEFVRLLRADARSARVPVIFYTAYYHEAEARKLAEACQVSRVLVKPCGADELLRAVTEELQSGPGSSPRPIDAAFDREHLQLVTDMLARKSNALQATNERLAALTELNVRLASERDPRVLLERVCQGARDLLGAKYAVLAVAAKGTGDATLFSTSGIDLAGQAAARPRVDSGILGRVAAERCAWRASSGAGIAIDSGLPPSYPPAFAVLAAPLASLTQPFGWICLADKVGASEFTPDDEHMLCVLAAQAGRIYENGTLYSEVRHHAAQLQVQMEERERAVTGLRASEERFRELAENIHDAFFVISGDRKRTLYMSPAYERIWGRSASELQERPVPWADAIHPDDLARLRSESGWDRGEVTAGQELEFRIVRPDGEIRWIGARMFPIVDERGNIERLVGVATDITQRKQADAKIRHLSRVYAMLSGINSLIVRAGNRAELFRETCRLAVEQGRFRAAWCCWLNAASGDVLPEAWAGDSGDLAESAKCRLDGEPPDQTAIPAAMRLQQPVVVNDLETETCAVMFARAMLARGHRSLIALPLVMQGRSAGCLVLIGEERNFFDDAEMRLLTELAGDISFALDHIAKAEQLNYLAYYDALTGLANRTLFCERLSQYVNAASRRSRKFALVIADMERFDAVNDTYGRHVGDQLLKQIAARLVRCLGEASPVARLGGDQFAAVIFNVREAADVVLTVEQWWRQCLGPAFQIEGKELSVAAKSGIALFPSDGAEGAILVKNAEAALKKAKASGERFLFYTPRLSERAAETLALENQLRRALEREEFTLHYQPKVDTETRHLSGVEALIRWRNPELGLVGPAKFIPILEETGMIVEVGAWVLHQASLERSRWLEQRANAPRVAVNVSTVQLQRSDFVRTLGNVVKLAGGEAGIDIEVTESLILDDAAGNIEKLREIRDLGVRICIDDFGTGYSSLGYLTRLPVHTLKIDRSFVSAMLDDPGAMTLVSTIISLAHSLKLTVVAEGVESEEQAKFLRLLRCDQMQGYLISKPLPFEELTTYLARSRSQVPA